MIFENDIWCYQKDNKRLFQHTILKIVEMTGSIQSVLTSFHEVIPRFLLMCSNEKTYTFLVISEYRFRSLLKLRNRDLEMDHLILEVFYWLIMISYKFFKLLEFLETFKVYFIVLGYEWHFIDERFMFCQSEMRG
jgi:hypothetical protein